MFHIKKDDRVKIITGKDKGKTGRVMMVFPKQGRLLVEGLNTSKKTRRRSQKDQQGGFVQLEVPLHISNVQLIDKKTDRPTRFGTSVLKDGTKVRVAKASGEVF